MIEIRNRVFVRGAKAGARLALPFERRTKTRQRAVLEGGEEVAILLPRGEVLRGGDLVAASDGRLVEVVASPEAVLHVTCATPLDLARAAYHLGNRHVPVEVGDGYLRIAADHVLEDMLRGLGATIEAMSAPFEPEAGAYAGGRHGHDHDHDHGHHHDHDHEHCDPDHGHPHSHDVNGPPPHPARIHHFGKKDG